jgi:biotin carboxyl carrier protein
MSRRSTRRPPAAPPSALDSSLNGHEAQPASAAPPDGVRLRVTDLASDPGHVVVEVASDGTARLAGDPRLARLDRVDAVRARLVLAGSDEQDRTATVLLFPPDGRGPTGVERREVVVDGWRFELEVEPDARARLRERASRGAAGAARDGRLELRAVIPGRILSVAVAAGDVVGLGDRLLVIEAMKMQNELRAPRAGTIERVAVGAGETVELRDLLVVIE